MTLMVVILRRSKKRLHRFRIDAVRALADHQGRARRDNPQSARLNVVPPA